MKKSIIFKTTIAILFIMISAASIIGYYVYTTQQDIIDKFQKNQKEQIDSNLKLTMEQTLSRQFMALSNLSSVASGVFANALDNADNEIANAILKKLFKLEAIKAIYIYDTAENEPFLSAYKEDGQTHISSDELPSSIRHNKNLNRITTPLYIDEDMIGYVELFYDNSDVVDFIKQQNNSDLERFNTKVAAAKQEIKNQVINQLIMVSISFVVIIFLVIYLLKKFVSNPLEQFKDGLESFFNFLKDPHQDVKEIVIDTNDEFGQMSKSINESIKVSMKMHEEMAQLMHTMDINVISSETDTKGIITYASQAFCKISGYSKNELIGQSHNLMRHPDMPKELYDEMWATIIANKTWRGEIKNLKKDGSYYWVDAIISPKYGHDGQKVGYTAIRYDITDKKKIEDLTQNLELKIKERTKALENLYKHTRESIEYSALIQGAVVAQHSDMKPFFKDSFVYWMPKDTVGGDIWLFNQLRHEDECLLFIVDCTGHGVPGAFVTMIVKAIEREIVSSLKKHPEFDISPAIIMSHFNKTMKTLLKQTSPHSKSNAGWDGAIIYYNRRTQTLKFCGAETPLFYVDISGELHTVKGTRYSVGYKKCDMDYQYKETIIDVKEGMQFYCTTDGFLDQNGGEKDFPFGKTRFRNIIKESHLLPMDKQKEIFLDKIQKYESMSEETERNDDMTLIGFTIGKKSEFKEDKIVEIVKYDGVITQNVIASAMDNIEAKITNMNLVGTISTIVIEYCQNMMHYSKNEDIGSRQIVPAGEIDVQYINGEYYEIIATNIVSIDDKEKIEPKLKEIQGLDRKGIRARYKELRKSGKHTHDKGGGIGMYEIAKVSDGIEYNFLPLNEDKYIFMMKSIVKDKKKKEI